MTLSTPTSPSGLLNAETVLYIDVHLLRGGVRNVVHTHSIRVANRQHSWYSAGEVGFSAAK